MKTTNALLIVCALALAGCDSKVPSKSPAGAPAGAVQGTSEQAVVSNVIVTVGGESLTQADLEAYADVLYRRTTRGIPQSEETMTVTKNKLKRQRVQTFPGARLLCQEALRRGLAYDKKQYDKKMASFSRFSTNERTLAGQLVAEDLLIGELRKQIAEGVAEVPPEKIERCLKRIVDHNETASQTNAATLASLDVLRQRIVSGEISFEDAAKQVSEDEWLAESGCEWGEFNLSDLEGEDDLLRGLAAMKNGGITGAIACDNGYALVRLDGYNGGVYTLSRIFRRRMALMDEETADQLRTRFKKEAVEKQLNELARKLLDEHRPIYPNGNFTDNQNKKETK